MSCKIIILDYGMGNLNSVKKKMSTLNCEVFISSNTKEIINSDKIILPGVGHFQKAMENLKHLNLIDTLNEVVLIKKKPILGICLGMQLFSNKSEEGNTTGLSWIEADVAKFKISDKLKHKVPHVGWNQISHSKESMLMKDIPELSKFYFVHSYHLILKNKEEQLNETEYEYKFPSAIEKSNIFGVQYHPEKSHDIGDVVLRNFVTL